ncbi:MAG: N-carbamoylputrescine amidase, partial [Gammaproteobacteria bacterium]|nr:N-carbamoylputrescine amidase [Gammaproteobacteria bacterium]
MHVTVACTQMACSWDTGSNVSRAESLVHRAADAGANIVLLQELFETPYFCIDEQHEHFELA